jgi:hypothetical protein
MAWRPVRPTNTFGTATRKVPRPAIDGSHALNTAR